MSERFKKVQVFRVISKSNPKGFKLKLRWKKNVVEDFMIFFSPGARWRRSVGVPDEQHPQYCIRNVKRGHVSCGFEGWRKAMGSFCVTSNRKGFHRGFRPFRARVRRYKKRRLMCIQLMNQNLQRQLVIVNIFISAFA